VVFPRGGDRGENHALKAVSHRDLWKERIECPMLRESIYEEVRDNMCKVRSGKNAHPRKGTQKLERKGALEGGNRNKSQEKLNIEETGSQLARDKDTKASVP